MDRIELARRIAEAAAGVPGVVDVDRSSVDIAQYGRGGRVPGVAIADDGGERSVTVAVRARYMGDLNLVALAGQVRNAVERAAQPGDAPPIDRVDVVISDLVVEEAST